MRCTSTRSAPNRRHATSQPLSEPSAARRHTATEHRALAEARHGGTAAARECPGGPAAGDRVGYPQARLPERKNAHGSSTTAPLLPLFACASASAALVSG